MICINIQAHLKLKDIISVVNLDVGFKEILNNYNLKGIL